MKKRVKKKMGRPTKLTKDIKGKLKLFAIKGFTDIEISEGLGITERTLNNWKKKHDDFFQSLKEWKLIADAEVEKSLFMSGKGFTVPAVHISNHQGEITQTPIKKYYPPNPVSAIFWLKNRQPDKWRDRKEITGADGGPMQVNLVDYGKLPEGKKK